MRVYFWQFIAAAKKKAALDSCERGRIRERDHDICFSDLVSQPQVSASSSFLRSSARDDGSMTGGSVSAGAADDEEPWERRDGGVSMTQMHDSHLL